MLRRRLYFRGMEKLPAERTHAAPSARAPDFSEFTFEDGRRLIRVMWAAARVSRHYDHLVWLNGELQRFLPHQMLISAYGRMAKAEVRCDITSALPGVRTAAMGPCHLDRLVAGCYARWVAMGREPFHLSAASLQELSQSWCRCPVHLALRRARSAIVHVVRDANSVQDDVHIAVQLSAGADAVLERFGCVMGPLFLHIDAAFRRIGAWRNEAIPDPEPQGAKAHTSRREQEILEWLSQGKRNAEIGALLGISPATVKNHVRSAFRKLGARNRVEAVTLYRSDAQHQRPAPVAGFDGVRP
jgi:transcriptional regulator EpsA